MGGEVNFTIRYPNGHIRSQIRWISTVIDAMNSAPLLLGDHQVLKRFQDELEYPEFECETSLYPHAYGFIILDHVTKTIHDYQGKSKIGRIFLHPTQFNFEEEWLRFSGLHSSGLLLKYGLESRDGSDEKWFDLPSGDAGQDLLLRLLSKSHNGNRSTDEILWFEISSGFKHFDYDRPHIPGETRPEKRGLIDHLKAEGYPLSESDLALWNDWAN